MKNRRLSSILCVLLALVITCLWVFTNRERRDLVIGTIAHKSNILLDKFSTNSSISTCLLNHLDSEEMKTILYIGAIGRRLKGIFQFEDCEYSNCVFQYCNQYVDSASKADVVVFDHNSLFISMFEPSHARQHQLRFVYTVESPGYSYNKWNLAVNDFNGTWTYRQNSSPLRVYYGMTQQKTTPNEDVRSINFAKGKTKGAYAYVSNCGSVGYDRLATMRELSKYIDVDIFGSCTGKTPCPTKMDVGCEGKVHSQYRFYLAFENSLCKDYITEKFWRSLVSKEYFLPIAMGGRSLDDYYSVAPPNSFLHAYNFTSIAKLGRYLQLLMNDDEEYNHFFQWRRDYEVTMDLIPRKQICKLCETVNHPKSLSPASSRRFADEWNNPQNCRSFSNSAVSNPPAFPVMLVSFSIQLFYKLFWEL